MHAQSDDTFHDEETEQSADGGKLVIYQADAGLSLGRVGNVLIACWRQRVLETTTKAIDAASTRFRRRRGEPLILINHMRHDIATPDARERKALFAAISAHRGLHGVVAYIWNGDATGLLPAIVDGMASLVGIRSTCLLAMVPDVAAARRWVEPFAHERAGALSWENVLDAIGTLQASPRESAT